MLIFKMIERNFSVFGSIATIILLGLTLYHLRSYLRTVYLAFKLTGPPAVPILGNALLLKEKDILKQRVAVAYNLYGPILRIWVLLIPFFAVLHPDDLQVILSSKKHTNKAFLYRLMHNFLGEGLITSSGEKWSSHRKLIQPAFHLNLLENFVCTFVDASQILCKNLSNVKDSEINIGQYVNSCVIDILNEAVLGVPCKRKDSFDMENSPFRQGKVVIPERFFHPWLVFDSIYRMTQLASEELDQKKRLDDFTRMMIRRRRDILSAGNNNSEERKCLLDFLIEISDKNPDFTEEDIVHEACTFMLAGQDSVGAAAAFTIFLLAQNPDCQQRCVDELHHIFVDSERTPTISDLREMRYLEMCIKESLRLYPSVPLLARKLHEPVQLRSCTLPAGSNVFLCPFATHRITDFYPNPEEFDPERWTPENCENRHPYAYLPFSAGPRYCIGNRFAILEMKTVISTLLRRFVLLPVPGKTTLEPVFRVTLRASGGIWVRLKVRDQL